VAENPKSKIENPKSEKRLVAYVVPHRDRSASTSDLRRHLKSKLPEHMVPSSFVMLDDLPLTANGKVDRRKLLPADPYRVEQDEAFTAPRTPVEKLLAEIWTDVLKIERVGIHDNFFELGGHSLLATQVLSRVRDSFKRNVSLKILFARPTIKALAELIQTPQSGKPNAATAAIAPLGRNSYTVKMPS
jgi:hypothetical protein